MAENTVKAEKTSVLSKKFGIGGLIAFALPSIITALFSSIYGIVDGLFVSNVGGATAFGAVNLASPLFAIIASLGFMFGTGGSALVGKILGEGDKEKANRVFSLLTYTLIAIGIVAAVALWFLFEPLLGLLNCSEEMMPYCLAYGHIIIPAIPLFMLMFYFQSLSVTAGVPKFGLIVMLVSGFSNIIGDAVLVGIVAKGMGDPTQISLWAVRGAAIATAFGLIISGLVPIVYYSFKNKSSLRLGKTSFKIKEIGSAASNGLSEFLSNISSSVVNTVFNGILLAIIGDMGVAAYGAISYVNTMFTAIFMGYSIGVSPLISYAYGAKDHKNLQNIHKKSIIILVATSVLMTVIAEVLGSPLAGLFGGGKEEVKQIIVGGMIIFAISFLFKGINMYASSFFTALNNGLISGLLAVLRSLIFSIGTVILMSNIWGLNGVWWSVNATELLGLATTIIFFIIYKKRYNY